MATIAYQRDKSGFVALLSFLNIVWGYLADVLIFDESLNAIEFIAAIGILIFALGTAFYKVITEYKQKKDRLHEPLLDYQAKIKDKNSAV